MDSRRCQTYEGVVPPKQLGLIKHLPVHVARLDDLLQPLLGLGVPLDVPRLDVVSLEIRPCARDGAQHEDEVEIHVLKTFWVGGDSGDEAFEVGRLEDDERGGVESAFESRKIRERVGKGDGKEQTHSPVS
jgi:hypothetical protein